MLYAMPLPCIRFHAAYFTLKDMRDDILRYARYSRYAQAHALIFICAKDLEL